MAAVLAAIALTIVAVVTFLEAHRLRSVRRLCEHYYGRTGTRCLFCGLRKDSAVE